MAVANVKVQPTEDVSMSVSNYGEAHAAFLTWHPQTLQREGPRGMTFDYMPIQAYKTYLDATVGPGNWESQVIPNEKVIAVTLSVFSIRKSASASVWPAAKIKVKQDDGSYASRENTQPNESEKAEARAFRRAAADHGMLRYLWEKDTVGASDDRPAYKSSGSSKASYNGAGSGLASDNQIKFITEAFAVPKALAAKLTGGRGGQCSALIDALKALKNANEDEYEDDPTPFIRQALTERKKGADGKRLPALAPELAAMLDVEDEEDSDNDED